MLTKCQEYPNSRTMHHNDGFLRFFFWSRGILSCTCLGRPCPPGQLYHLPPQNRSPWTPLPEPLCLPPPYRASFKKTPFFFFLYALETSKIRHKLRNLLRPWGPCPYHLPPRNQSPWTPLPEPLYPPPPHRATPPAFYHSTLSSSCLRGQTGTTIGIHSPIPYKP